MGGLVLVTLTHSSQTPPPPRTTVSISAVTNDRFLLAASNTTVQSGKIAPLIMGNQVSTEQLVQERLDQIQRGKENNDESANALQVKTKFIDSFNTRNMRTIRRFCADGSIFCFKGGEQGLDLDVFMDSVEALHKSFPDIVLTYDDMKEVRPGVVKVRNVVSRGSHTGAPYAFPPFQPVPTSGIVVQETADWTVYISGGKMTKFRLEPAPGDVVGPAGYYFKVGGKINALR